MEGARSHASGQVAYLGAPPLPQYSMQNSWLGSQDFAYGLASNLGGTIKATMMAGSWIGLRDQSPGPSPYPYVSRPDTSYY